MLHSEIFLHSEKLQLTYEKGASQTGVLKYGRKTLSEFQSYGVIFKVFFYHTVDLIFKKGKIDRLASINYCKDLEF